MAAEEHSPAIVLRTRDYLESDRIVTLITRDFGRLSGIARGAKVSRRRFERRLEPFSHVMLRFRRRPHGELMFIVRAEAEGLESFLLEHDLARIAMGSYALELCEALTPEADDASDVYTLLVEALRTLERAGAGAALRQAFEMHLLAACGLALDFARCRLCGAPAALTAHPLAFVTERGGIACARCRPAAGDAAVLLPGSDAAALAALSCAQLAQAPSLAAAGRAGAHALSRFIAASAGRRLRSVEFLERVAGQTAP